MLIRGWNLATRTNAKRRAIFRLLITFDGMLNINGVGFVVSADLRERILTRLGEQQQDIKDESKGEGFHLYDSSCFVENSLQVIRNRHRFEEVNIRTAGISRRINTERRFRGSSGYTE